MISSIRGVIDSWHAPSGKPHTFDKCRGWLGRYDLLKTLYPRPKMILTIRDLRGIISSMEKQHRKNPTTIGMFQSLQEKGGLTIQGRVDQFLSALPVGTALESLFELMQRDQLGDILILRAEDVALNPAAQFARVSEYLGLETFDFNFEDIGMPTWENDTIHEPYGDHEVHKILHPLVQDWETILTPDVSNSIIDRTKWYYSTFYRDLDLDLK